MIRTSLHLDPPHAVGPWRVQALSERRIVAMCVGGQIGLIAHKRPLAVLVADTRGAEGLHAFAPDGRPIDAAPLLRRWPALAALAAPPAPTAG